MYNWAAKSLKRCATLTHSNDDRRAITEFLTSIDHYDSDSDVFDLEAAAGGNSDAMASLGLRALQRGDRSSALVWFERAAAGGHERSFFSVLWLFKEDGRWDEAKAWIEERGGSGTQSMLDDLVEAEQDVKVDQPSDASKVLGEELAKAISTDTGIVPNSTPPLGLLERLGATLSKSYTMDIDGMTFIMNREGNQDLTRAMEEAVSLAASGEFAAAIDGLTRQLAITPSISRHWPFLQLLSGLYEGAQQYAEALDVWHDLSERGNLAATRESVRIRERLGSGDSTCERWLRGEVLRGSIDGGSHVSAGRIKLLADHLSHKPTRKEEAAQIRRYGLMPDGQTSPPWHIVDL